MTAHAKPARRGGIPYGLMSLYDMINVSTSPLPSLFAQLKLYEIVFKKQEIISGSENDIVDDSMRTHILGWMKIALIVAQEFEISAAEDRIKRIIKATKKRDFKYIDAATEIRVLLETLDDGFNNHLLYRYTNEKARILSSWKNDWSAVVSFFPEAESDIRSAVDLWCLCHPTASVFQFMRVLEFGLRAMARDVGVSFDVQNWQNAINDIESKIREIGKTLPRGASKSERLRFLSEAAKEFAYFKDGWRNHVSHARAPFDDHQARSVMEHVRQFMTILASGFAPFSASQSSQS